MCNQTLKEKTMYTECPACGCSDFTTDKNGMNTCDGCNAIFGEFKSLAETRNYVYQRWFKGDKEPDHTVYYDFTYMNGKKRTHGWFDPITKTITQIG
jgi:hypothetical protein